MTTSILLTQIRLRLTCLPHLRWRDAAIILVAIFAVGNWQLLTGRAIEKWDAYDLATPYYSLLSDFIRAGRFLYWNPWVTGGSPDFAIAGAGNFSPDLLFFAFLTGPGGKGYQIYWLTIWLAGGLGMLALARHLRAPVWGGLTVAVGFFFSGFYTGHAEHSSLVYSYSLLPLIIWRLDVALTQPRILPALQTGALWGLSGLAGYPAFTVYTVGAVAAWAAGRLFFQTELARTDWKRVLLVLAVVGATGVAVLSPSYVSAAYEGRGYSDRSGPVGREFALSSNALHPGVLVTLGSPAFPEMKLGQKELWSYTDASCLSLYTGAVTLLLAFIALSGGNPKERRWRWFLFSLGLLALACAMSRVLPFRGWMYDLVPPTRYFRHSGMLRGYFLFALSVLALFGSTEVSRWRFDSTTARSFFRFGPLLALCAWLGFGSVAAFARLENTNWPFALVHLFAVWGALGLLAILTRRNFARLHALVPALLTGIAACDALCTSQFADATVVEKQPRPKLSQPFSSSIELRAEDFARSWGTGHANVNTLVKLPTLRNYTPFKNEFHEIIAAVPHFADMALGNDRTWFSEDVPEVEPSGAAFVGFANRMWELNAPVLVRHSGKMMLSDTTDNSNADQIASLPPAIRIPTSVISYEPEKLVLDVTAPADGWAMISERWSRSWKANVNGQAQPISGGNFVFRAVRVVKGINRIEFTFEPLGLPGLIILSWSLLGLTGLVTGWNCWKRRQTKAAEPAEVTLPTPAVATA